MEYIIIHDIGINQAHYSSFHINRPEGLRHWLLLVVKSRACFFIDGQKIITEPNTAIIYSPGMAQNYSGISGEENYCDNWMEFSINESHLSKRNLPIGIPIRGFDHVKVDALFSFLLDEHFFGKKKRDMYLRLFTIALLEKIGDAVYQVPENADQLEALRKKIFQHPEYSWDTEQLADEFGYSLGYFQKLYKEHHGVTLKSDIINCRIERASILLTTTTYSISKVGELCGYQSDNYFVRQFRQIKGLTPLQYRKKICKKASGIDGRSK